MDKVQVTLPLPFEHEIYKEELSLINNATFIVCAMFTPHKPRLFQYADRLASSCNRYNLPFVIYKVTKIHKSITPNGQDDLAFTKANFIYFHLEQYPTKNILYLDIDVFLMGHPSAIIEISRDNYDFAIYNWLNDEHNEAYVPINLKLDAGDIYSSFYRYSHRISFYDNQQLLGSGSVQYYRNSNGAKYLLKSWWKTIASNPGYADDQSLDYAYNNFLLNKHSLKSFWLDKSYCRYPWWPYIKPIILHPELPRERELQLIEINKLKRFYPERCIPKQYPLIFPPDYLIDTSKKLLLKVINNQLVDVKPIDQNFWIYPEDVELV